MSKSDIAKQFSHICMLFSDSDCLNSFCIFVDFTGSSQIKPGFSVMIVWSGENFQMVLMLKNFLKSGSAAWTQTNNSGMYVCVFLCLCLSLLMCVYLLM